MASPRPLKAATHLYNDGVRIFITLGRLRKAINNNSQGASWQP
jgi:hypothetical protein